jgi:hypothetical protein
LLFEACVMGGISISERLPSRRFGVAV